MNATAPNHGEPMIADFSCPPGHQPPGRSADREGRVVVGRWDREALGRLARHLEGHGSAALDALSDRELLTLWDEAVGRLLDPRSEPRRLLDPPLVAGLGLTPPLLQASLEAMLAGHRGRPARELVSRAAGLGRRQRGLVLAILAGNVPGLAVQVLLPALALRRPILLKSSRREPLLTAALVHLLTAARPELADALAAATWPGGVEDLESELLAAGRTVVAFGGRGTLADLETRLGGRTDDLVTRGPRVSIGVVGRDAEIESAAAALAEDVVLFEQRGCLSVVAVWVEGRDGGAAREMASSLAGALEDLASRWPPPDRDGTHLAAVQQMRRDAAFRGARVEPLDLALGTVVLETDPAHRPVPAARAVRVHPIDELNDLLAYLEPHVGRIQGAALAGRRAWELANALVRLEVWRLAPAGELQRPDALWPNGARHLIEELA